MQLHRMILIKHHYWFMLLRTDVNQSDQKTNVNQ